VSVCYAVLCIIFFTGTAALFFGAYYRLAKNSGKRRRMHLLSVMVGLVAQKASIIFTRGTGWHAYGVVNW
jgi:hypothetical protein